MSEYDVYIRNGYKNREDYLRCLAADYGLPYSTVDEIADVLGPNEDFDGLLTFLEDMADSEEYA